MTIPFYKFQGTGNDFIIIDDRFLQFPAHDNSLVKKICDRRFGVGGDGLILLQPDIETSFYMKYYNSDGRESTMCGNGGRCIAAFASLLNLVQDKAQFNAIDGKHDVNIVKTSANEWYVDLKMQDVAQVSAHNNHEYELNTGSPHYLKFLTSGLSNLDLITEAREIRYNKTYAQAGINVNFIEKLDSNAIKIRTYERGVENETLSCGTGATAAAIGYHLHTKQSESIGKYTVEVEGGELSVRFKLEKDKKSFTDVWLSGPAKMVFEGTLNETFL